jgi:hypothetical protein
MNALIPAMCANSAQTAAKAALLRRVEAAARANEERQDAPRGQNNYAKHTGALRTAHPEASLVAQILGARYGAPNAVGYGAYDKASRLLNLESHRLDVTLD